MKRGREEGGSEGPPSADRQQRPRHSRLDSETLSYYSEIDSHFKSLTDAEEKQLLADNALGEAAGREVAIATDAACSRVLEALLRHASTASLCTFTAACVEGENLGAMCTSGPFGSHVLEKLLVELGKRGATAAQQDFEAIEGVLTAVTEAAAECLYEMATSKYGSFVARRLLCVLSGRDVAPPPGKKQQQAASAAAGGEEATAGAAGEGHGAAPKGGGALAAKLGSGGSSADAGTAGAAGATSADYPELVEKLVHSALSDDWAGEEMTRLATDSFAGPVLQALLRASTHNTKLQQRLLLHVLGGSSSKGVESVALERCHALMQDRNGSHLMEVVFQTAPDDYFAKLTTLCFKGHLLPLAQHGAANFAVQAALSALRKPQQLKRMFEDLRPAFPQLLRSRRSGVIAALLAAAGRLASQEAEASAALWAAAGEGAPAGGPLAALLTLDTHTQLGGAGRLSTLGCAMAATLLRLPPAACKQWGEALAALAPGQLQHVARDPGGCRVLEAYLEGPGAAAKRRRQLLRALAGCYGEVAAGGSGSHFVEKCYALAEVAEKELIAGELAAAEPRLLATHRGPQLLRRCHVEAYKKGSDGWQKRVAAADAARREFEDLFGEGEAGAGEGRPGQQEEVEEEEVGGEEGEEQQREGAGGDEEAQEAEQRKREQAAERQKKRKKKREGVSDAAGAAAAAASDGRGKDGKKKKKARQQLETAGEDAKEGVAAAEKQPKKKKQKKQRGSSDA